MSQSFIQTCYRALTLFFSFRSIEKYTDVLHPAPSFHLTFHCITLLTLLTLVFPVASEIRVRADNLMAFHIVT